MNDVTVTYDPTGWDQEEINSVPATSYSLLFKNGIDIIPEVNSAENTITVRNAPATPDVTTILTTENLHAEYLANKAAQDADQAIIDNENAIGKLEVTSNPLFSMTYADTEIRAAALTDIASLREEVRLILRFIRTKNLGDLF